MGEELLNAVGTAVDSASKTTFSVWFLIGASFMLTYTDPVTGEVSKGI